MSRPRKPYGAQHPGRLPATMMKVLAAEMSDPQRLKRGKQYAKDGSVSDIIVEAGVVTCEIQGSRATPYIASLEVTRGSGMPLRRDVAASCSCPDDANYDGHACKHVIATMFVLSDELLMEPELLDVWRGNDVDAADLVDSNTGASDADDAERGEEPDPSRSAGRAIRSVSSFDPDADDDEHASSLRRRPSRSRKERDDIDDVDESQSDDDDDDDDDVDEIPRRRRHLQLVRDGMEQGRAERREQHSRREREPIVDPLADVLSIPDGAMLPEIPQLDRSDERLPRRPELATILREAYRHLRIEWD
ncbi:MAG: putative Zn finger protein [Ilumatobacter sp.]|jgi:uncharacterized Zn finger protein